MNGRIERLFGTLKQSLDQIVVRDASQLMTALAIFREWYNEVRPHNNLCGRTPSEAWRNVNPYARAPKSATSFSEWDGLLEGVRMRR
jgi:putative transposase